MDTTWSMATVIIAISDTEKGGVKIVATPSFEEMAMMINSGSGDTTSAHGYALRLIRAARELSKEIESKGRLDIFLPRIG